MLRPLLLILSTLRLSAADASPSDALFRAIQNGDAAAVKRLLSAGADPNAKDAEGLPALMAATLFCSADCLKLLLNRGADPNAANAAGATPLMWAIPDAAKVKLFIARGANVNARSTNLQRTPLLIASSYPSSVEVLQLLVDKGADIHAKDRSGTHALGRATLSGDVSVVRFLVEHGCDPNEPGYGPDGLWRNFARHDPETISYLLAHGAKMDPMALTFSANWHDPKSIEQWIDRGANVNARYNRYNRTALMTAASSEQATAATLKVLLEKGADPNAEDIEGERPLDWATYRFDNAKIDVLRQFGATPGHGPRRETYPGPEPGGIADARTALTRGLALLLPAAPPSFERRACITCHNQALPAEAAAVARGKGVVLDDATEQWARKNLQQILTASRTAAEAAMQGDQMAGNMVAIGSVMSALASEHHPLDKITAAFTHLLASLEMPDGRWLGNGMSRPPLEDSRVSQTAWALRALTVYPIPGRKAEIDEKVQRAQRWLFAISPTTTEERNMRLMGLVWSHASAAKLPGARLAILKEQRPDGGWSQLPQLATDAYATGQSLMALHEAGISVTADSYRKGVAFLLKTQYQNGAWFVKTRSFPTQPYYESGYPFGHNQWISAAGASWASLAIAQTLPEPALRP